MSVDHAFEPELFHQGDAPFFSARLFECHDIGDYDLSTRFIASDTFLAGNWVFEDMTAGKSFPLSVSHFYFP